MQRIIRQFPRIGAAAVLSFAVVATGARADGLSVGPVKDPTVAKECSACHMLYPAGLLPARSWSRLMNDLGDHFGDNAELDPETAEQIRAYLTANAADTQRRGTKLLRNLPSGTVPLRITELPYIAAKHAKRGRVAPATLKRRGAKSPADCKACHRGAEQGQFDDD